MPFVEYSLSDRIVHIDGFVYQCAIADGEYDYCLLVCYLGLN